MSVLETPRLMFRGQITFDPIVTNNQSEQYNEDHAQTVFDGSGVDAFRKAAIDAVFSNNQAGNWNPHGTHRSVFFNTRVTGVDLGDGPVSNDPIVDCPVSFTGMLVDLEPYGAYSSQLFFDSMSFGIQGGCRVFAPRADRMTGRYVNFFRNTTYKYIAGRASVVWQTSFPKGDGLKIDQHDSDVLKQFAQKLEKDEVLGLTVRWNAYRTLYFDSLDPSKNDGLAQQLQAKLMGGGFQPNPARSELVGVLGLWRKGEPASEPGDRALLTRQPNKMASAHVRLTDDLLTLDLANSVPETGVDLKKLDLGDLTAFAVGPDGQTILAKLGTFKSDAYNREAYERSAGIVTLKVDPAAAHVAQTANIQLRQTSGILLAEAALRAIPASPNLYVDQNESKNLDVLVLDRGMPSGAGVTVTMTDPTDSSGAKTTAKTDVHGIATFPITGTTGQVESFVLVPGDGAPIPPRLDPLTTTYVYVRTLPADADIAALQPTWENVHGRVLRNWEAMAPCMDNWLNLGDPDQVKAFAPLLRKLTDKNNFEAFRFMPVTRDMTAGERALLYAFLDGRTVLTEAVAAPELSLEELSREMRRS